jgi:hypothetical protein
MVTIVACNTEFIVVQPANTERFRAVENELSLLRRQGISSHASTLATAPAFGDELIAAAERNDI